MWFTTANDLAPRKKPLNNKIDCEQVLISPGDESGVLECKGVDPEDKRGGAEAEQEGAVGEEDGHLSPLPRPLHHQVTQQDEPRQSYEEVTTSWSEYVS